MNGHCHATRFHEAQKSTISMMKRVMFVGDSRRMKGGVSTVIKAIEKSYIWEKYHCYWLECQINSSIVLKIIYLIRGLIKGLFLLPFYDIIHFHTTPGNGMVVQLPLFLYSMLWHKKRILHLHVGNQIKEHHDNGLFLFCLRHSDLVLTLGKSFIYDLPHIAEWKGRTDFLYNPAPDPVEQKHFEKYFLFAAYININKGYDTLLEAFSQVVNKHQDFRLIICGVGDLQDLQRYVNKYHLKEFVEMPGWVDGAERDRYFRNAYAYCMTSRMEGLPLSVLESMSYGVPVISTRVGCLPEFLTDNESVLFFHAQNAEELADRMNELIEHPEFREHIAREARKIIRSGFSIRSVCEKLDAFYQSV